MNYKTIGLSKTFFMFLDVFLYDFIILGLAIYDKLKWIIYYDKKKMSILDS